MAKKPSNEIKSLDAEAHRRFLKAINEARRPEDIKGLLRVDVDQKLISEILRVRNSERPLGFINVQEIQRLLKINIGRLLDLIALFGRAKFGEWKTPYETKFPNNTPYHVAHAAVLKTGWVLFLPEANTKTTLLWNPSDEVNPVFEYMIDTPDELLFCSGHSFLSDGRLLVVGGGGGGPSGVNRAWKFDPVAKTWQKTSGDMEYDRWYPTVVTLSDERRILAVGGRAMGGLLPARETSEIYDELTDSFKLITGPDSKRDFPQTYPGLHLLPGGEVFYTRTGFGSAGPGPGGPSDPLPTNAYLKVAPPSSGAWVELPNQMEFTDRVRGMSVILFDPCDPSPSVRVLVVGGGSSPGNETAEIITLSTLNPMWDHPMIVPGGAGRNNVNAVLLPDGTVFVVGGTSDPSVPCALFNPKTHTWSEMARANYRKQYHSVAVLLPSGKVAATGGSNYGGGSNVIEIFSPPYLFKPNGTPAERPVISSLPDIVHHSGGTFAVKSPQAANIGRAVFVRPMAVTHQTDSEQRVIPLDFTRSGNTLTVTVPDPEHPHGMAPRGYYMLFIINDKGVPSEGKFIFLH
jgi:hypothetical protein